MYKDHHENCTATKACETSQLYATARSGGLAATQARNTLHQSQSRPSTGAKGAYANPHFGRQLTEWENKVHPPFLNGNANWVQEGLQDLVAHTQTQALTTTGVLDGTRGPVQAPRAVAAVHSYNDVSPVLTSEYTRDTDKTEVSWDATINRRGLNGVHTPPMAPTPSNLDRTISSNRSPYATTHSVQHIGDPEARKRSVDSFWHRQGTAHHLKQRDVIRMENDLGEHAVAGSANAKLVGGKWKYVERPTEGSHLFTEFYGRYSDKHCDYYGRSYHYLPQ